MFNILPVVSFLSFLIFKKFKTVISFQILNSHHLYPLTLRNGEIFLETEIKDKMCGGTSLEYNSVGVFENQDVGSFLLGASHGSTH